MQILVIDPHDNGVEHEWRPVPGVIGRGQRARVPSNAQSQAQSTRVFMVSIWIRTTESTVDRSAVLAQKESIFDVVLVTLWKSWKQVRQQSILQMEYVCSGKWYTSTASSSSRTAADFRPKSTKGWPTPCELCCAREQCVHCDRFHLDIPHCCWCPTSGLQKHSGQS